MIDCRTSMDESRVLVLGIMAFPMGHSIPSIMINLRAITGFLMIEGWNGPPLDSGAERLALNWPLLDDGEGKQRCQQAMKELVQEGRRMYLCDEERNTRWQRHRRPGGNSRSWSRIQPMAPGSLDELQKREQRKRAHALSYLPYAKRLINLDTNTLVKFTSN